MIRVCGFPQISASKQKGNPAKNYDQMWRKTMDISLLSMKFRRRLGLLFLALGLGQCGSLSIEDEQLLGEQQVAQLEAEVAVVANQDVTHYIEQLGSRLLAATPDRNYQYRFRVVRSDALNAFAIAGGNIYVTTGAVLASRNVAELASILAHEIGHIQAGHIREHYYRFRNSRTTAELTGITLALITGNPFLAGAGDLAVNLGTSAYIASHTREAEGEADAQAFTTMRAAGFDPRSQLTLLSRLHAASINQQRALPFLLSHPLPVERVEEARTRLSSLGEEERLQVNDAGSLERVQEILLPR